MTCCHVFELYNNGILVGTLIVDCFQLPEGQLNLSIVRCSAEHFSMLRALRRGGSNVDILLDGDYWQDNLCMYLHNWYLESEGLTMLAEKF
jgi:hypothetical protein